MGIFGNLDTSSFKGVTSSINMGKIGLILALVFVFIVIAVITFMVIYNKNQKKKYTNEIRFMKTYNNQTNFVGDDLAEEIKIPGTSVKIFYLKDSNSYYPKLSKLTGRYGGRDIYTIWLSEGGEPINIKFTAFDGKQIGVDNESRPAMTYANENLKELIKRNFTDKAIKWWKEYAHIIGFVIIAVVVVVGVLIMFSKFGKVMGSLNSASLNYKEGADAMRIASETMMKMAETYFKTSGVMPA